MINLVYSIIPEGDISDQQLQALIDQLPLYEKQRILRLKQKQDRILSACGLLMIREAAGDLGSLKRNAYGKPFLESPVNFSISHSGKMVACAYTDATEIGMDLEEIRMINIHDFHMIMTKDEIRKTNSIADFYKLWTKKEAVIKAVGKGFSIDAKELFIEEGSCSFEGQDWILSRVQLDPGYECYVAHKNIQELVVKEFFIGVTEQKTN